MIGYLKGKLLSLESDRILLLVDNIGYEVLLPEMTMTAVRQMAPLSDLALYIYHQQTEKQPKPVLIGFTEAVEKEFFQFFLTVEDIGPLKAVKALSVPVDQIAAAIEAQDTAFLKSLKGIGARTAQKMIASLEGKLGRFVSAAGEGAPVASGGTVRSATVSQVQEVLVQQLGHKPAEAKEMIDQALKRNSAIDSPEALLDEVYRGDNR